jgi:predicted PurR-regulated permease PerM
MAEQSLRHSEHVGRAVEIFIHLGLICLLLITCLYILRPFAPLIVWGIIIAIAIYPAYRKLQHLLGERGGLAAVICTLFLLALLIVPVVLLAGSFVDGVQTLTARLREGTPIIPPPPPNVEAWPIVGAPLNQAWQLASSNLSAAIRTFLPQIKAVIPGVLAASAGIGIAVVQWVLSILLAGVLLPNREGAVRIAHSLAVRLFGEKGSELEKLAGATIRSVTTGIIGVALIQSACAAIGFLVGRLPGAGIWAGVFLVAAVLQIGIVVLVPAVIYMFAIATTTKAVIFLVWCIFVALMDNVLKPLLLGRGVEVPMVVVFLGAIGGFIAMGSMGLFVGAIVLSVGYKLSTAWLEIDEESGTDVSKLPRIVAAGQ